MPSAKELRDQLRALRKEAVKPISKMRMGDVSAEIERLKGMRAETPAVASTLSPPTKKVQAASETIKEAKASEFPVKPESSAPKKKATKSSTGASKGAVAVASPKKKDKMAKLKKMLEEMSDTDTE